MKLLERARASQVGFPATVSTPVRQHDPGRSQEPWFPGDEDLERRIRAYIRWNAAVMVTRANIRDPGIGGHLSTYASSAVLVRGRLQPLLPGQGQRHSPATRCTSRATPRPASTPAPIVEGRLGDEELDNFRFEVGGHGLSSYPHPRLMPELWEFPTVSMGLGPLDGHLPGPLQPLPAEPRSSPTRPASRVWCFVGDGEFDEPETHGGAQPRRPASSLDNLVFVVSCNLQRLDGPVRGNGKIIQELEALLPRLRLERHQGHLGSQAGTSCSPATSTACSSTR